MRLQHTIASYTVRTSTAIKKTVGYIFVYRSNHLNGLDYDALETASVTSCSSAYSSSKSESSTFSPFGPGSITELSDVGSCDTFLEYDPPRHSRVSYHDNSHYISKLLRCVFSSQSYSDEMINEIVPRSTQNWDKVNNVWFRLNSSCYKFR